MNNRVPGMHFKWIALGVDYGRLVDTKLVIHFLADAIEAAGMRPLGPPHVYDIREELRRQGLEPDADEPEGVSGIQVLSTSHVAVDTWPHRNYIVIDLFSCSLFVAEKIELAIRKAFEPDRIQASNLSDSLEFEEGLAK